MKQKGRDRLSVVIAITCFAIFSYIITNNLFFLHSHVSSDGTVIFHAHPYKKDSKNNSDKSHHHTAFEFLCLHQLQEFYDNATNSELNCEFVCQEIKYLFSEPDYTQRAINTSIARAPPIV